MILISSCNNEEENQSDEASKACCLCTVGSATATNTSSTSCSASNRECQQIIIDPTNEQANDVLKYDDENKINCDSNDGNNLVPTKDHDSDSNHPNTTTNQRTVDLMESDLLRCVENTELYDEDEDNNTTNDDNCNKQFQLDSTTLRITKESVAEVSSNTSHRLIVPSKDDIIIEIIRSNDDDSTATTTATLCPRHTHWPGNIQFQQLVEEQYRQLGINIPTTKITNPKPQFRPKKISIDITKSIPQQQQQQESNGIKSRTKRKQSNPICCSRRPTFLQRKELATMMQQLMIASGQRLLYNPTCSSCTNRYSCYCTIHLWNAVADDYRIQRIIEQLLEPSEELPSFDPAPTINVQIEATTTKTTTTTAQTPLPSDPIVNLNNSKRAGKKRAKIKQRQLESHEQLQEKPLVDQSQSSFQLPDDAKRKRPTDNSNDSKRHDGKKKSIRIQQKLYLEQIQQQQQQQQQQQHQNEEESGNDYCRGQPTGPIQEKNFKLKLYSSEVRKYNPGYESQPWSVLSLSDAVKLRKRNIPVKREQEKQILHEQQSRLAEPIQPLAEIMNKKSNLSIKFKLLKPPPTALPLKTRTITSPEHDTFVQHAEAVQPLAEIMEMKSNLCIKFRLLKPLHTTRPIATTKLQEHDDPMQDPEPVQPLAELMEEKSEFCLKFKLLKPPPAIQPITTPASQEHDDANNDRTKMVSRKRKHQHKVSINEKSSVDDTNDLESTNDGQVIDNTANDAYPISVTLGKQNPDFMDTTAVSVNVTQEPVIYTSIRKKQDVLMVGEKTDCFKFYPSWPGNVYFHTVLTNYYDIRCNEIRAEIFKRNVNNCMSVPNNVNIIDNDNPIVTSKDDWEIIANGVIEEINRVGGQFLQRHDFDLIIARKPLESTIPLDSSIHNNHWIVLQSDSYISEIICEILRKKIYSQEKSSAGRASLGTQVSHNAVAIPKAKKQKLETESSHIFLKKGISIDNLDPFDDTVAKASVTAPSLENASVASLSIKESKITSSNNSYDQALGCKSDKARQLLDPQYDSEFDEDDEEPDGNELLTDIEPDYPIEPEPTPEQVQRLRELCDICARIKINDPSVTCADIDYSFTTEMINVLGMTLYETLQENRSQQLVKAMGLEIIKFREELLPNKKRGGPYKQLFDYLEMSPVLHTVFLNGCHVTNIAIGERFLSALSKTQSLKYLIICNMSFSLKSFSSLLQKAKALETLELEGCALVPDDEGRIIPRITNFNTTMRNKALKDISFRGPEMFQDSCLIPILSELLSICDTVEKISCTHVDNTDIQQHGPRSTEVSTEVWCALSDFIARCETVNHISFSRWTFQSKELEPIVKALRSRKPKRFQISLAASCRVGTGASSTFMSLFNNEPNESTSRNFHGTSNHDGGASILFIGHGCKLWKTTPAVVRILFDNPDNSINDLRLRSLGTTELEIIIRNIVLVSDSLKFLDLGSVCTWDSRRLRVLIHYLPWFHKVRELTLHVNCEENNPKSAISPLKKELLQAFEKNDSLFAVSFPYCEDEYAYESRDDGSTPPRSSFWTTEELNLLNRYLERNKFASDWKSDVNKEVMFPVFASCLLKTAYGCSTIFRHLLSITEHDFNYSSKPEASDLKGGSSAAKEFPNDDPKQIGVVQKDEETRDFTDCLQTRSRRARNADVTNEDSVRVSDPKKSSSVVAGPNNERKSTGVLETPVTHDVTEHPPNPRSRRGRKVALPKGDFESYSKESLNELPNEERTQTTVVPEIPVKHGVQDQLSKSRSQPSRKAAPTQEDVGSQSKEHNSVDESKELPYDEQTQTRAVLKTHGRLVTNMNHSQTTRLRRSRKPARANEEFVLR